MRKTQKGFTLIELGIVIAVIAILAAVVMVGRGFIETTKVTKALEGVATMRKAVSTIAGVTQGRIQSSLALEKIFAREFYKSQQGGNMHYLPIKEFCIYGVGEDTEKTYCISYACEKATSCEDVESNLLQEPLKVNQAGNYAAPDTVPANCNPSNLGARTTCFTIE